MSSPLPRVPVRNGRPHPAAVIGIVFLFSAAPHSLAATTPPGELLIKWRDGPDSPAAEAGNNRIGAVVRRNFSALGWQEVALPPGLAPDAAQATYRAIDGVEAVELNRPVARPAPLPSPLPFPQTSDRVLESTPTTIPNDPQFRSQWYLGKISATNAWKITTGSTNVVVAVLDTGVDYRHPDLAANMWQNPGETGLDANGHDRATNGIDDDGNGYVDDVYGVDAVKGTGDPMDTGYFSPGQSPVYHGTACAGIIGAVGHNGRNVTGVNWNVRIMAIRWYGDLTVPFPAMISHELAAWDYVVAMKRRGVNLRATSNSEWSNYWELPIRDAIAAAGREGILNVAIAGNFSSDQDLIPISFPGAYDEPSILSVAATTQSDTLTTFSGYGRSSVDLAAPGIDIVILDKGTGTLTGGWGTSFACPQVAGAVALLAAAYPDLGRDALRAALLGSVDHPPSLKGKLVTGGRLNLERALHSATNANLPAIVIYSSPAGWRAAPEAPLVVTFSRPMDHPSVEAALVIEPPVSGSFEWLDGDRTFRFHHPAPFDTRTNYTVRLLASALDATGGSLDGNFNQARQNSPDDDYLWNFRFPVAGDDFAGARVIAGESGTVSGSTLEASSELFELRFAGVTTLGSTVWYRWTAPPQGGWFTFDLTSGTPFDSVLAALTESIPAQLIEVAGNDNYGTKAASRLSFPTVPGESYSVVVASKASGLDDLLAPSKAGKFVLTWYPTPAPGFTGGQFSPLTALPGAKVSLTGTNFTGATAVLFGGAGASFTNAAGNNADLRITAVVPPDAAAGPITVVTPHGSATSSALFAVLPPPLTARLLAGGDVEISWNHTDSGPVPTFLLEATDSVADPASAWTTVDAPRLTGDGVTRVRLSSSVPTGRYFRLRQRAAN